MNKDLYNDITSKLISLTEEQATPNKIRGLLLSWSNRMQLVDKVSVLCAFYNYMNGRKGFNFINESMEWREFFKGSFENYFTIEVIKNSFDCIILDDKLTDIILKFAKEDVKKEFYEYAKSQNNIFMESLNTKYSQSFEKLENKCVNLGIVQKKINNTTIDDNDTPENQFRTINEISDEQDKLRQQIAELQLKDEKIEKEKEEKRDTIFSSVSEEIGVKKDVLVEKVGEENSYDVDKIVVSNEFMEFITKVDSKAASVPNGIYKKMLEKISSKRKLNMVELDISLENGVSTLTLSKKDTIFDKIASTSKEVLNKIKKSVIRKVEMAAIISYVGVDIIKTAVVSTNNKLKPKIDVAKENLKRDMNNLSNRVQHGVYNAVVGVGTAQMAAEDFISDTKEKIELAKQSAATKTAEKLRNFAERIEPSTDDISNKEKAEVVLNPIIDITTQNNQESTSKEYSTYINTNKGRAKVVLRAATKAGELSNQEEFSQGRTIA